MNLDFAKVCGKHSAIYEAYYKQIDPKGSGAIEAMTAAKFLKKSGLSDVVLSRVWDLSDPNGKGFLDKPGFFVALKLVSLAQAGQVVNMSTIYMDTPNPPKVGDLPKIIPPRAPPMTTGGVPNADWSIGVIDRLKYEQLFESQKPVGGKLPGNKVKGLLLESKLPMDTLGKIWDLADQDKDGNLDKHEFIVAMHLVYQTLQKRTVPDILPPQLRKPGGAGPPPKPAPPAGGMGAVPSVPMPRAPSGEGFGEGGFVANFPKDIAPPPVVPPPLPMTLTRIPPVGASSSVPQPLISTDPLIPIGVPTSANVEWVVTPSELIRYEVMFRDSDRDKDGLVSGLEVKNIFIQSGVPQNCLAHIWALCDTNQSGKLTLEQFALAMWMVERKQKGIEPPQVLTSNMVPPSMRGIIAGVDLQPQEPKPTYTNPELEMISKEIDELSKERRTLELEIAQKEADVRIKSGEVRSLQNELDTLSATLKQLENQRGEAQKRLDDLKAQVTKIREQCQMQEDTINEQEGELNAKRSELQKLKDEETALQKEYDDNNRELTKLTQHLTNTQLQISSIRSMVTQLMETQRQMTDALLLCRAAIENQDGELVSEYQLKIEPDLDDARKTLEKKVEEPKDVVASTISNGFASSDPFVGNVTAVSNKSGFDDSFSTGFSSNFDAFGGFGQPKQHDPFGQDAFANKPTNAITPDPGKDDFGSDPFAALHAPTGPGQVLNPNAQKSGPPPRPESPSPALPPKKSKVPPPRPAPPRPNQAPPLRSTPQSGTDAFGSSSGSGGFADFADFDHKSAQIPPPLPPPLSTLSKSNTSLSGLAKPATTTTTAATPFNTIFKPTVATRTITPVASLTNTSITGSSLSSLFTDFSTTTMTTTSGNNITTHNTQTHAPFVTPFLSNLTNVANTNTIDITTNKTPITSSTTTTSSLTEFEKRAITLLQQPQQQSELRQPSKANNLMSKVTVAAKPTDFSDDPFKDYRYEDPFSLKDPFSDDNDADVFADPSNIFKDDLSSDEDEKLNKKNVVTTNDINKNNNIAPLSEARYTPIGGDVFAKFDAFNLHSSPAPSSGRSASTNSGIIEGKSKTYKPIDVAFDDFTNFDAFSSTNQNITSTNNKNNNHINNELRTTTNNDSFFDAFNDNFDITTKHDKITDIKNNNNNNNNKNTNEDGSLFDAFGNNNNDNTNNNELQFAAFGDSNSKNIINNQNSVLNAFGSNHDNNKNKNTNNIPKKLDAFDAFEPTATTAVNTTNKASSTLFEDDFNDNGFGADDFFQAATTTPNELKINNNNINNNNKTNSNNINNFDDDSPSFVADFNTALNNSINMKTSSSATTTTLPLTKVHNKTTLSKLENSSAAKLENSPNFVKLPEKFSTDYSQADRFDEDLQEAIKRSMLDQ